MNPVKDTLCLFPLLVSYEAAGLLWMSGVNCDFVHNYMCGCACTARSICRSRVCEAECVCTHWCTLVGLSVYHVMAYTSAEATKEIHCQQQHSYWQGAIPPQRLMG